MSNPLKIFQNILLKSDGLEPVNIMNASEERLSVYDTDICQRIGNEVGIALMAIDERYWKNSKAENEYFIARLFNTIEQLEVEAKTQLETSMLQLAQNIDIEHWRMVYNNIQAAYEGLITLTRHMSRYYAVDVVGNIIQDTKLEYAFIDEDLAIRLKKECMANVGKADTTMQGNNGTTIVVKTKDINPLLADIKFKTVSNKHATIPNVKETSPLNGKNDQIAQEKIDYLGTVESLGLLISLLMDVELIAEKNKKKLISRVLSSAFRANGEDFASETLYRNFTSREFDHKNIPQLIEAFRKMREELNELQKKKYT